MSGADEKMRAVLERVTDNLQEVIDVGDSLAQEHICLLEVLERRLLPLLLAGQAMRDEYLQLVPATTILTWDRALMAAQGQPEKG